MSKQSQERCRWLSYNFPVTPIDYPCCNVRVFPVTEPPNRSFQIPHLHLSPTWLTPETIRNPQMRLIKPWFPPKFLINQPLNSIFLQHSVSHSRDFSSKCGRPWRCNSSEEKRQLGSCVYMCLYIHRSRKIVETCTVHI